MNHKTTVTFDMDGVYCNYKTYYGDNSVSTQIPVFEYTYNGTYYRKQTTRNISNKLLDKSITQGNMYNLYIDYGIHQNLFQIENQSRNDNFINIVVIHIYIWN